MAAALVVFVFVCQMTALAWCSKEASKVSDPIPSTEEIAKLPPDGGPEFNRLIHEKSPYLLQHARNPVDWYAWGPDAFARAVKENKPIFLSVGYSTCHWCHVMAHESFEHADVAALLNQYFISIKVDREERPDIDEIYMNATQLVAGRGGWPNSVWLTPDGRPWFAGTYFPREDAPGRAGFKTILTHLAETWEKRPDDVEKQANVISDAIRQMASGAVQETSEELSRAIVGTAVSALRASFDSREGGFGGAPKFPPHSSINLLLYEYGRTKDGSLLQMISTTLDAMALGGIRDHVGGGFHRYSTDAEWLVPHFEKMLYDNAQLGRAYVEAYSITGNEEYRGVAIETYEWVLREMTDARGGFYSAIDADSEGVEGKLYLWTRGEIMDVLGEGEGEFFCRVYQVEEDGNFRDEVTGAKGGGNIPHLDRTIHEVAKAERVTPDELETRLKENRRKLLERRDMRVRPHLDDKTLASWNGMMIGGLAHAGSRLEEPRYTKAAERAAEFIFSDMWRDGKLLHVYRDGESKIAGYLDDYAFLADGLLDLYEATGDDIWLRRAGMLADEIITDFRDERVGGFFFTTRDHEDLLARSKDPYDRAIPSGNAVAARVFARLARLENGDGQTNRFIEVLGESLDVFRGPMQRSPAGTASFILAAAMYFDDFPEAGIARRRTREEREAGDVAADAHVRAEPVTADVFLSRLSVSPGETFHAAVRLTVDDGWHVNSHKPLQEKLVPTTITLEGAPEFMLGDVPYGEGKKVKLSFSPEPLSVYDGTVVFDVPITLSENAGHGAHDLPLVVSVQACDNSTCLAPAKLVLRVEINVDPNGEPEGLRHAELFKSIGVIAPADSTRVARRDDAAAEPNLRAMLTDFDTEAFVKRYGYGPAFLAVYILGLGLTLTPCVYPIIPITVGYFGMHSGDRRRRRVLLACVFGLGVAVSYAAAGTIAAISGSIFGAAMHHTAVLTALALLCVLMGLNAFGVFELRLPAQLIRLGGGGSRSGIAGAAAMGLTMGIAGASCIAAFIVSLLAFVAERGSPALGFAVFLTLGLGFATPFVALGVFSDLLQRLPKSGDWLVFIKKLMGTLLFGAALYFLRTVVPKPVYGPLVFLCLATAGLYFGFFEGTPVRSKSFRVVRLCLGGSFFLLALWWSAPNLLATSGQDIEWRAYSEESVEAAKESGKSVVIDFYADWCIVCLELDRVSFGDSRVVEASRNLLMLRADMTDTNTPEAGLLAFRYGIRGFPTVVFIDRNGLERQDLRITQFVSAESVLARMRSLNGLPEPGPEPSAS